MKGKEFLSTYPKVTKVIREWFNNKMLENLAKADDDIPIEFKNVMKERGVNDDLLVNVIDKNPSALFEIFDSLQIYVGIVVDILPTTKQVVFNYFICPKGECLDTPPQDFLNRRDVEHYAMLAAIQYIDTNVEGL